jgi:UDP-N-acetylmuramoyl-tripeptide--D-alanyl-D-alanine ligase
MSFNQEFVQKVVPAAHIPHATFPAEVSFAVDSRLVKPGDIFVALPGAHVDGHEFCAQVLKSGAAGILIDQAHYELVEKLSDQLRNKLVIMVPDTTAAFVNLAIAWRQLFSMPVVGITGSVGKTSTKEMLVNIFSEHGLQVVSTQGTQNTRVGVAMNIFKMRAHHQVGVFELGISKRGEMAELAHILRPTYAIITNIGHAHMQGLGSLVDIAQEKRDIFKFFTEKSIGIINGDQPLLSSCAYNHPVIRFGCKTNNQIQARKVRTTAEGTFFTMKLYGQKYLLSIPFINRGYTHNSLAAAAAAHLFNVPALTVIKGLQKKIGVAGRFEKRALTHHKGFLIHDCYNAVPESMKAALVAFQSIETNAQKIAVIGDMLELGVSAVFWHRQIGRFLRKTPSVQKVLLVGSLVQWVAKTMPVGIAVEMVATWQEAVPRLQAFLQEDSVVLVKGSRGMALDKLVEKFT